MTHLRVSGWLTREGFRGHAGREDTEPMGVNHPSERFALELRRGDEVLHSVPMAAGFNAELRIWRLRGSVPYVEGSNRLTLSERGRVVHDVAVAASAPRVHAVESSIEDDVLRVRWHAEGETELTYRIGLQLADGTDIPLALDVTDPEIELDISHAPRGEGVRATVRASDGVRSGTGSGPMFALAGSASTCRILRPRMNQKLPALQPITLLGTARRADGAEEPVSGLEWRVDGKVRAKGKALVALPALAPGAHTIEMYHPAAFGYAMKVIEVLPVDPEVAKAISSGLLPPP